jgi:signal transduction histidine kinase
VASTSEKSQQHSMQRTPSVSAAEEMDHRKYLDRSCSRAMFIGVSIYILDAIEPWLDFHDPTAVRIQLRTAAVIALIFSLSLFGWGKKHKLAVVTLGLLAGSLGFESIVYREGAFNTAYAVGFPVLFAYYAVLLPVSTRIATSVGIALLLLNALPETIQKSDVHVVLQSVISNFTAFAIILYARVLANTSWHKEYLARESITDFVSNVSHECESPVKAISENATLLRKRMIPDEEIPQKYEEMERLSHRVRRQLRTLIEFGRLENGQRQFRFSTVDPGDMVEDAVADFIKEPSANNVHIDLELSKNLPYISADYDSMRMVLWNLLDNARKYSLGRGTISVLVRPSRRLIWRPRFVHITIEDEGIGIPRSEMRSIYTKFVRGDHAKNLNISGTGIGLSIVRQVLTAHNAKMMAQSEVGKGSTFTIILRAVR